MRTKWITLLISLVVLPGIVFASGKIKGKIVDKSSSEPLVGASVNVVGTTLGAAADVNGEYNVLNVPDTRSQTYGSTTT